MASALPGPEDECLGWIAEFILLSSTLRTFSTHSKVEYIKAKDIIPVRCHK